MSFVFFGTPEFSKITLEILTKNNLTPSLFVTSPDKPVGRKQILTPSPVKQFAAQKGLKVKTPATSSAIFDEIANLNEKKIDFAILAAYGFIISPSVIQLFPHGILNIHPSLLPKYRGPTPIQTAIINGDEETGVTIIKLNEKIDEGEIVAQEKTPIDPNDTSITLGEKLFKAGTNLLIKILPDYLEGKIKLTPQNNNVVTGHWPVTTNMTKKFTKQDGFILFENLKNVYRSETLAKDDKYNLSHQIYNKFRAFQPWPGIWTNLPNGKRMLITKCHLENEVLKIDFVKIEGKQEEKFNGF